MEVGTKSCCFEVERAGGAEANLTLVALRYRQEKGDQNLTCTLQTHQQIITTTPCYSMRCQLLSCGYRRWR